MNPFRLIMYSLAMTGAALGAAAQETGPAPKAPPTRADYEKAFAAAEVRRAQSLIRFEKARNELVRLDASIEKQVGELVQYLTTVTDSTDSGTEIARIKEDVIQSLRKAIDWYARERVERLGPMKSRDGNTSEQAAKEVGILDDHINTRVEQMLAITASLTKQTDFKKYETYYDDDSDDVRRKVRKEYKQDKKASGKGEEIKEDLAGGLEKAIQALEQKKTVIEQRLKLIPHPEARKPDEAELAWIEELLENRRQDLRDLTTQDSTGATPVGDKEADNVRRMIQASILRLKADWIQMQAMESQYSTERTRLEQIDRQVQLMKQRVESLPKD